MKKILLFLVLNLFLVSSAFSQVDPKKELEKASSYLEKKGEVYFTFNIKSRDELRSVTKIVSIDAADGLIIKAFANKKQFQKFINLGYSYSILTPPSEAVPAPKMYNHMQKVSFNFDAYPTYPAYVALLNQFAAEYPSLCKVVEIGTTVRGRKLLFLKISDNINSTEGERQFMYTSTMHGDETAGYMLMLRLINHLLVNYNSNSEVKNLVDNLEIWINPLANPDGTYAGGDNTVAQATRYNANNIDLNRNYPDQVDGAHPDGEAYQPETTAFMNLAAQNNFVLAANFHGGAEVVNYPWDNKAELHPEDAYFQTVSREYASLCQANAPAGYMNDLNNGITNGYAWYPVGGGRQDYMYVNHNCKEVTIELSATKLLPESQFAAHWTYNNKSLIAYMKRALPSTATPGLAANPNPANNSTGIATTKTLSWTAGTNATSHDVYFGTSATPTLRGNQTLTTFNPGTLTANTTYYWRVDEKNSSGTTIGPVWKFTTTSGGTITRIDRTDAGGTITARGENATAGEGKDKAFDNSTSTKWLDRSATSWIQFQFAGGNKYKINEYTITSANDAPERDPKSWILKGSNDGINWVNLDTRTAIAFSARFQKQTYTFNSSTAYAFYKLDNITNNSGTIIQIAEIALIEHVTGTTALPGLATNPSPANNSKGNSTSITLTWTAGTNTTSHDVYFGTTTTPTLKRNQAGTTFNPGTLTANTTYYWRVDEKNSSGITTGAVWNFTTAPASTSITAESEDNGTSATADGPVPFATNVTGTVSSSTDVDWYYFNTTASGAINISLSIANSSDLDWYLYTSANTTTEVAKGYTTSNPEAANYTAVAGKYFIKVVGYNGATAPYTLSVKAGSAKVSATTMKLAKEPEVDYLHFTLHQNNPNPVSASTVINYDLQEDGLVTLKVYDVLGTMVENLVHEFEKAGSKSVVWDSSSQRSGLYFYTMTVKTKKGERISKTKKMMIVK